ncbi:MAG: hypothetical protein R3C05_02930 [Pirellulaceae bacterium]
MANFAFKPRDGTADQDFGIDGIVDTRFAGETSVRPGGIEIGVDGRIIVLGQSDEKGLLLARYTSNGELDVSFSGDGLPSRWMPTRTAYITI